VNVTLSSDVPGRCSLRDKNARSGHNAMAQDVRYGSLYSADTLRILNAALPPEFWIDCEAVRGFFALMVRGILLADQNRPFASKAAIVCASASAWAMA
jgi:hypothetical protein